MIKVLILLALALVFGGSIFHLSQIDNEITIRLDNSVYSLSILALLIRLVLFLVVLFIVFKVVSAIYSLFRYPDRRAQDKTYQGLIYFIEGNWSEAKRALIRGSKKSDMPIVNYLAAARCAHALGEDQATLDYLNQAEKISDKGQIAVLLTQAKLQYEHQQYDSVLQTLKRAKALSRTHPMVLHYLSKTYMALKDWPALEALMPELHRNQVGTNQARAATTQMLYRQWFDETLERAALLGESERLTLVQAHWQSIPRDYQFDTAIFAEYALELIKASEHERAEKLLTKAIKKQWHDEWVHRFGLVREGNVRKRLSLAESWLKSQPNNATLLQTLGRLYLQNEQWAQAQDYFEKSIAVEPRADTYAELARLSKYLNNAEKSQYYADLGLQLNIKPLPDMPMPDNAPLDPPSSPLLVTSS